MPDLSIIIPAANEEFLQKTIDSIYATAKGDIEIIAITEGYDPILYGDKRLRIIHNPTPLGQRQAINQGVAYARGRFIFKLDAHCSLDKGFDVVLMNDCKREQTMIPRLYVLDASSWTPKWRKMTDFMYINSPDAKENPFQIKYYDAKCKREHPEEYQAFKKAHWTRGDIAPTMACLGAAFFMHRERFLELGGMDEAHAHWGQMGVELGCKSWLSGGELLVNKRTWYAHQWRPSAPWNLKGSDVQASRTYSIDLWTNNKWSKQIHKLSWLVDKFSPVPGWKKSMKIKTKMQLRKEIEIPNDYGEEDLVMMSVKEITENRLNYASKGWGKVHAQELIDAFRPFIKKIHEGVSFTDETLLLDPYASYLVSKFKRKGKPIPAEELRGKVLALMHNGIELYASIKRDGLKAPLEMAKDGKHLYLMRGSRRVEILALLGWESVPVHVFESLEAFEKIFPSDKVKSINIRTKRFHGTNELKYPEEEKESAIALTRDVEAHEIADRFGKLFYDQWNSFSRSWMGVKISKYPTDLFLYQRILFELRPDVIIETGTYMGGTSLFLAHMFDILGGKGRVITVDKRDLRGKKDHPRITYITGRSTSLEVLERIKRMIDSRLACMVILDSDHSELMVRRELSRYSKFVTPGQFLIADSTYLNGHPIKSSYGSGPYEAVEWFLARHPDFERVPMDDIYLLSKSPKGYLRKKDDSQNLFERMRRNDKNNVTSMLEI